VDPPGHEHPTSACAPAWVLTPAPLASNIRADYSEPPVWAPLADRRGPRGPAVSAPAPSRVAEPRVSPSSPSLDRRLLTAAFRPLASVCPIQCQRPEWTSTECGGPASSHTCSAKAKQACARVRFALSEVVRGGRLGLRDQHARITREAVLSMATPIATCGVLGVPERANARRSRRAWDFVPSEGLRSEHETPIPWGGGNPLVRRSRARRG
jgi:hypothetical protein